MGSRRENSEGKEMGGERDLGTDGRQEVGIVGRGRTSGEGESTDQDPEMKGGGLTEVRSGKDGNFGLEIGNREGRDVDRGRGGEEDLARKRKKWRGQSRTGKSWGTGKLPGRKTWRRWRGCATGRGKSGRRVLEERMAGGLPEMEGMAVRRSGGGGGGGLRTVASR